MLYIQCWQFRQSKCELHRMSTLCFHFQMRKSRVHTPGMNMHDCLHSLHSLLCIRLHLNLRSPRCGVGTDNMYPNWCSHYRAQGPAQGPALVSCLHSSRHSQLHW